MATKRDAAIRPFRIDVPDEALTDLRRRIAATRLPERETVSDHSQGVQLATIQKLAHYWEKEYDWRKCEAKLNALPQFIIEIDGLDIHFIHVRSKHENALPLIVTHGWPGSIIQQLKIIDPLTNPTTNGGTASDAFHLVIPSIPGYGFSGKPSTTGWDPARIARAARSERPLHGESPFNGDNSERNLSLAAGFRRQLARAAISSRHWRGGLNGRSGSLRDAGQPA